MSFDIHIIGGGLAGSEAAWQLAEAGLRVRLSEMRGGGDTTPAHESDRLAEMVCSNSFRSDDAVGLKLADAGGDVGARQVELIDQVFRVQRSIGQIE